MKQKFETDNDFYVFPEHNQLFDLRNYEVKYWHKATYDTLSKFSCESKFNYANPELFTGVCNGKLPSVDRDKIVETDQNQQEKHFLMYKEEVQRAILEGVDQFRVNFDYRHRNKNKSFLLRNKTIYKYRVILSYLYNRLKY